MKQCILYIPGLGDHYDDLRSRALRQWCSRSRRAQLIPMYWDGNESYEQKYHRAAGIITCLHQDGYAVSLVGESAGGSMAVNLFSQLTYIKKLVLVAGVASPDATISSVVLHRAPAFGASVASLTRSLAAISRTRKRDIHTVSGLVDSVVRPRHSHITDTVTHRFLTFGHVWTIVISLTAARRLIIRYATSRG